MLSKSTAKYDGGLKFVHYRSIPTLQDYLTVSQESVLAEHYCRQPDNAWLLREYVSLQDVIRISSIGAGISLAAVYEE